MIMKTKIKIIASIILLVFFFWVYAQKQIEITKAKQELLKIQKQIEKTKYQLHKEQELKKTKKEVYELEKQIEKLQTEYKQKIWLSRCLEIKQELEIKQIKKDLSCKANLEKFATYNLQKTKESLGL